MCITYAGLTHAARLNRSGPRAIRECFHVARRITRPFLDECARTNETEWKGEWRPAGNRFGLFENKKVVVGGWDPRLFWFSVLYALTVFVVCSLLFSELRAPCFLSGAHYTSTCGFRAPVFSVSPVTPALIDTSCPLLLCNLTHWAVFLTVVVTEICINVYILLTWYLHRVKRLQLSQKIYILLTNRIRE